MQIRPISNNIPMFQAQKKQFVIGYDDTISKKNRDYIRSHYNPIPYYNILENNGRLSEYELNKLISSLVGKHITLENINTLIPEKKVTETNKNTNKQSNQIKKSEIKKLSEELYNVKNIKGTNSSYRGSASNLTESSLETLSKAGIKNVIALTATMVDEKECNKFGLNLITFSPDKNFFENEAFQPKPKINIPTSITEFNNNISHNFTPNVKTWEKNKNQFIENFVNFIQTMQKDSVYIGCDFGTFKTDEALMLNHFFNPKATKTDTNITKVNSDKVKLLKNLYNNLTEKDKNRLGWDNNFDKKFLPKLNNIIKKYKI